MSVQTLSTPSGDKLVVLSAEEYEDLLDIRKYQAAMRMFEAGNAETLNTEEMLACLGGPSQTLFWREHRGLSRAALASAASVPEAELARIEAGATDGDLRYFVRLAAALRVRIDDLVIDPAGHGNAEKE